MENYSSAMKYMDIAADSAGTATEKFALYTDSLEAKIASFTAALEHLTMDTVDSDFVKDLVSAGTAIVEFVDKVLKYYPQKIAETKLFIEALGKDIPIVQAHPVKDDAFSMTVMGQTYTERKEAGEAIIKACMLMSDPEKPMDLGEFRGFPMQLHCDGSKFRVTMKQNLTYSAELADDPVGNVTRVNNALEGMADKIQAHEARLVTLEKELVNAQEESERPFPKEEELRQKSARLTQLNRELEQPTHKTAEHSQDKQDEDVEPDLEDGDAPAREPFTPTVVQGEKPSIRAAIRSYNPPAPVPPGMDRSQRREAAL